jgi:hypothetical protein
MVYLRQIIAFRFALLQSVHAPQQPPFFRAAACACSPAGEAG